MLRWHGIPLAVLLGLVSCGHGAERITYRQPIELGRIDSKKIYESSGLAVSRRDPGRFWTHNDSGDKPRLYCIDRRGKYLGTCRLEKAGAVDWEDMCSYELDGHPKLLVADVGDNLVRRKSCRLYIIDEPKSPTKDAKHVQIVRLRYSTGAIDCEAVGVDAPSRKILFVEKRRWISCRVFMADLPGPAETELVAKPIGTIGVPIVTAMDISPDGRRAIVMTLGQAFEFTREGNETWQDAIARKPRKIDMPARKQGEAICYGANGRDLYLTSELRPTPMFFVEAVQAGDRP